MIAKMNTSHSTRDEFARTLRYYRRHTPRTSPFTTPEDRHGFNLTCIYRTIKQLKPGIRRNEIKEYLEFIDALKVIR